MNGGYARSTSSRSSEPGRGGGQRVALSRQLNNQITQAANLQELIHMVVVNFSRMNAVNYCTAYHRIARHVQDQRTPPDAWPPHQQQQLGGLLTELNQALIDRLEEVQAHNLGLTLWSTSKTHRLPQQHCEELWAALQAEITRRLATVSKSTYMTDKHYNFGPQSLSNIVYSAASMGLKPDYDLLHGVARAVVWQAGEFKPQGLANILWGMGKLGVKVSHEVRQMVDALCREVQAQLTHSRHKGSFAPQNVSNTLHGIVNIGIVPSPELLSALVRAADGMLRSFGAQELTNLVWSLSQMHRCGVPFTPDVDALLTRIPDELSLLFGDRAWRSRVRPQTISNLALAYAHLGRKPQLLMALLMKEAMPLLPQFKPQELSNLLWSMASMEFWHGPGAVESITQAACGVADRMKPQEIANCCWAWATMRFFPGAEVLDLMLAHAEAQLDRFKSQELGMLTWAVARLAYMPAASLVRACLPLAAEWRNPAVQDCGNLLWAFTVLGILTPEVMSVLGHKMLSLPREAFTQEAYIQLYQAKMSLSQAVHDIAAHIPPELLARGETEWRQQAAVLKVSATHRDVAAAMAELGIEHDIERRIEDGLVSVDIALRSERVAVEVDGSAHFTQNEPFVPLGRTLWRWRLLASRGWRVVSVPYFRWGLLRSMDEKKRYLYQLLQCRSVWDCYSLDPQDRDAPPSPPANLAHLTPEEVFQYASEGVACSTLLHPSSTPGASPTTPLLAGLGPVMGGAASSFTPADALRPASASSGGGLAATPLPLPLPLPLTSAGLGQPPSSLASGSLAAAASARSAGAAASGSAYSRLPDNLYSSDSPRGGSIGAAFGSGRLGSAGSALNIAARPFTATAAAAAPARTGSAASSASPAAQSGVAGTAAPCGSSLAPTAPSFSPGGVPAVCSPGSPSLARGTPAGRGSYGSSTVGSPALPPFTSAYSSATPPPPAPPQLPSLAHAKQCAAPRLASPKSVAAALPGGPSGGAAGAPAALAGLGDDSSDDDIGDLRSYFGSVIGVSLSQPQEPQGPLSVEEVRRKLALLPAEQAVADVAPAWLEGWDAAQAAELLSQLDSPTTASRALQLFEWLRGLAPDSPQAHLCSPAAYTTMIVLYGRWRKPKPAVRLFAELKDRGEDSPEVHSALVEAFCRSGQYDVALDAYRNMLAQGLPPTPAALLAVLDLHMQRSSWEEADAALAGWAQHGGAGGAQVFDAVIERACAAGNTAAAESAFGHMCAAGVAPSAPTFAALLAAVRQQHPAPEVAELAVGLLGKAEAAAGAKPGRAMQALQEACRSHGWYDVSQQLLARVEEAGAAPSLEMVNGVLAACAAGGAAQEARQAFDKLARHGLQPSADSYLHLVEALCRGGQWAQAALTYESMLAAGVVPSEQLASLAVDALWCTGLAWAQARALELFQQATSAGWLPPLRAVMSGSLLKLDLRARHAGTGMLRMHRWLLDLRASIGNSGAACVLDEAKRVCVISSSPPGARGGGAADRHAELAAGLKDSLGASLMLHGAPFRVTHEDGRAQRMESSTFMLKKWLFTASFEEWDQAFGGAAALAGGGQGPRAKAKGRPEERLAAEVEVEEQSSQMYGIVAEYEAVHPLDAAALHRARYHERRRELVGAAQQLVLGLGLGVAQVWHAAVVLLDRCAAAGYQPRMDALLVAACVALAADKEGLPLGPAQLAALLDREATLSGVGAEPQAALQEEVQLVAAALQGDTACLSAVHCWKVYSDRMECDVKSVEQTEALLGDSFSRLHQLAFEDAYTTYPPSILAAAAVYLGRKQRGMVPFWPSVLRRLTGYHEQLHPELSAALRELQHTAQYGSTVSQAVFS